MDKKLISAENTEFINEIKSLGNKLINSGKTMIDFTKKLETKLINKSNELCKNVEVINILTTGDNDHVPKWLKMEVRNTDSELELDRLDNLTVQQFPKQVTKYEKKGGNYQCHQCRENFKGKSD